MEGEIGEDGSEREEGEENEKNKDLIEREMERRFNGQKIYIGK